VVFDPGVSAVAAVEAGGDLVRVFAGLGRRALGGEGFVAPTGGAGPEVEGKLFGAGQGFGGGLAQQWLGLPTHSR
jgi:hypothetical protein